jgi:putative tryptophan/tyrosine transport system substrate-binding protein
VDRRRFLLTSLAGVLAVPLAAEAQVRRIPTVGVLSPTAGRNQLEDVFAEVLREHGWVKDQNVRFESRYSAGRPDALPPLATELVALTVDVLVAWSPAGALAAKKATSQIPVVFLAVGDPVGFGLVSNLARPGGNVTGVSFDAALETYAKALELLKEAVPSLTRMALLASLDFRTTGGKRTMAAAAKALRLELHEVEVKSPADLEPAVHRMKDEGIQAMYIWPSGLTFGIGKQIADLALTHRLPSVHPFRENAMAGGLLSYAPSLTEIAQRGAVYVDKILKGAKLADLPVEQPTKFELVINLKTAKALGFTIPPSLLLRADQVIE